MNHALMPTPFHARTAERNPLNAWKAKGAFTVPERYGDPRQEALAARLATALFDISANEDLRVQGSGASTLLAAACGSPLYAMGPGESDSVHWCADGGGLRGFGVVSCISKDDYVLRSADADIGWFAAAAPRFDTSVREVARERGLLLLTGPFAIPLLIAAGLDVSHLEPKRHIMCDWGDMRVTIFRCARPFGYELSAPKEDATLMFDRIVRAGRDFGLTLAGEDALQVLQLETGVPISYVDFMPAREPFARTPLPAPLGIQPSAFVHGLGVHRATEKEMPPSDRVLAGLELESEQPIPFALVFSGGREIGRSLRSAYSPALRSAIALAQLQPAYATAGTSILVRHQESSGMREVSGRVVTLPFL